MKIPRLKLKVMLILLLPIMLLLKELLYMKPEITERFYARFIYPPIGSSLSKLSGILPFSVAELLLYASTAFSFYYIYRLFYKLFKSSNRLNTLLNDLINLLCILSVAYCLFLFLWGFNYYRQPLAVSLNYQIEKSTVADLKELCSILIDKTNQLRLQVKEDSNGIIYLEDFSDASKRSNYGYQSLSQTHPFLSGSYGRPKGVALSYHLSYTGIAGIYFPYTGEANVNKLVPYPMLPSTICHEMAHQRGFAREDEANFIAYLTCKAHPDTDFQYSGYLLATIYSMSELYKHDPESYKELALTYNDAVKRDLKHHAAFWKQFEGPAEELQERINDTYLKSNKQTDGIYSYGRMVDLLLAEYKKENTL